MITKQYFVRVGCYTGTASTEEEAIKLEAKFECYERDKCSFQAITADIKDLPMLIG